MHGHIKNNEYFELWLFKISRNVLSFPIKNVVLTRQRKEDNCVTIAGASMPEQKKSKKTFEENPKTVGR